MRHGVEPVALAKLAIAVHPRWLQLRAKRVPSSTLLRAIDALVEPAARNGVALVVNDRPDLASLANAPFVHVGQGDLTKDELARFDASLRVGISTHSPSELEAALRVRPAYVAFGPVYDTESKDNPDPTVGLAALAAAHARCLAEGIPLVAIGGIDENRVGEVSPHAEGIAVLSALFAKGTDAPSLERQLEALRARAGS